MFLFFGQELLAQPGGGCRDFTCNAGVNVVSDCAAPGINYGPNPCNAKIFCANSGATYFFTDCNSSADTDGGMSASFATAIPAGYAPPCCASCQYVQWNQFAMCVGANQIKIDVTGVDAYSIYWTQAQAPNAGVPGGIMGDCNSLNFLDCHSKGGGWQTHTIPPASVDYTKPVFFFVAFYFKETGNSNVNFKVKECCNTLTCTPTITAPANASFSCSDREAINNWFRAYTTETCGNSCSVTASVSPSALPACGSTSVTFDLVCNGQIVATSQAATITTTDNTAPVFSDGTATPFVCPETETLACNATTLPDALNLTATDNCAGQVAVNVTTDAGPTIVGCTATQSRTYTATDACTNSANCVQTFTWRVDTEGPAFDNCPQPRTLACNTTQLPAPLSLTATDACGGNVTYGSSADPAPTMNGCIATQNRYYTATDACNNTSTCTETLTWRVDAAPPVFVPDADYVCPQGGALGCNPQVLPAAMPDPTPPSATDACGGTVTIANHLDAISSDGCTRAQVRYFVATDACGNTATTCSHTFNWTEDTQAPTGTCPGNITVSCLKEAPCPSEVEDLLKAAYSDPCGAITITRISDTGNPACLENGTFSRTMSYSITDPCRNSTTCTINISGPCQNFCTYSQGGYGNIGGAPGAGVVQTLINKYGPIVIGRAAPGYSLTVTTEACVLALLPGGGTPGRLASGNFTATPSACKSGNPQFSDGRLRNGLAAQTITLQLNIWYNTHFKGVNYGNYPLYGPCSEAVIPSDVLALMDATPTVAELLTLVNNYLGNVGGLPSGIAGSLNTAVNNLNLLYHACATPVACGGEGGINRSGVPTENVATERENTASSVSNSPLEVSIQPNPASEQVEIRFFVENEKTLTLSVANFNGMIERKEIRAIAGQNSQTLDLSAYPAGMYFILLTDGKDNAVQRFVKMKR